MSEDKYSMASVYKQLNEAAADNLVSLPYSDILFARATAAQQWLLFREHCVVGSAAGLATAFSHPLDLVKTRLQLQGELRPPASYTCHYRTIRQSLNLIVEVEGVRALYKGFAPAVGYNTLMNLVRVFVFEKLQGWGVTADRHEDPILWRYWAAGCVAASTGVAIASPLYLAKVQTLSQAPAQIAVGWQHNHPKSRWVLWNAFRGHRGYFYSGFQGGTSAVLRTCTASTCQLFAYTYCQHALYWLGLTDALSNSCVSAVLSTVPVVLISNPVDVLCTRMYNQELGAYYKSNRECAEKLLQREGWRGFYKGLTANYLRTAPHMVLTLILWDSLKRKSTKLQQLDQGLGFKHEVLHSKLTSAFEK